ncbi:MAG: HNH endonuclease signature motif containing protein, partial [Ilumatobacteraceae bacterium]
GRLPIDHLDELGRAYANERVRDHLVEADSVFAGLMQRLFHWQWRLSLQRWPQLADADGVQQRHADAHESRRAAVHMVGEQAVFEAEGGTLQGTFLREVLERFVEAEWMADCDEARQRLGVQQVSALDLARTHRQRTFDALVAVFAAAASAPLVVSSPDPLINVVVDDDTADRLMRLVAGGDTRPRIPLAFQEHRCETIDGVPLAEAAVAAMMLTGRLRRVLLAPDGVVIDMGRTRRLFTGGAREAAMLTDPRCLWPGCERSTGQCETDHLLEWSRGGPTSPRNAGRACRHHNLFRTAHGYTARRQHDGRWDVRRPDGTVVGDLGAAA